MLDKKLTLTIVIPAYNEERYLHRCLDAIAAQSEMPDQVIVVDNNSTDGTAGVVRRYHFATLLTESRQGITFARNRGFDAATSDIIGRIDADTVLPSSWVAQVKNFFSDPAHDHEVVTSGCRFYNLHTGRLTAHIYSLFVYRVNRLLLGYYFPWGSNSALPRAAWIAVRGEIANRADIHEDLDLGIQLHRHGYRAIYRPQMRVGARAKRVLSDRGELWTWLTMWPRTFRVNGLHSWPIIWPVICGVWLGRYWIFTAEALAEMFKR